MDGNQPRDNHNEEEMRGAVKKRERPSRRHRQKKEVKSAATSSMGDDTTKQQPTIVECSGSQSISKHFQSREKSRTAIKEQCLQEDVKIMLKKDIENAFLLPKPTAKAMEYITSFVQNAVEKNSNNSYEISQRVTVASLVEEECRHVVNGCRVEISGSSLPTGLKQSDLNLNLMVPIHLSSTEVQIIRQRLEDHSDFENVEVDLKSDVPKIRFNTKFSKLKCTLCLNQQNAVDMSSLLTLYNTMDERAHSLAVMFRLWAKLCLLDRPEMGSLSPHALNLMTIYYLQQLKEPVLPVVNEVLEQEEISVKLTAGEREKLSMWKSDNKMTIGELWWGLLRFYLFDFKYEDHTISIRNSNIVERPNKKLPGKGMMLEDPLMPRRNASRNMAELSMFRYYRKCLLTTYKYFTIPQTTKGPLFDKIEETPYLSIDNAVSKVKAVLRDPLFQITDEDLACVIDKLRKLIGDKDPEPVNGGTIPFEEENKLTVFPFLAEEMLSRFTWTSLSYKFESHHFTKDERLPEICIICRTEGHTIDNCTANVLPPLIRLPRVSQIFVNHVTHACEYIYNEHKMTKPNLWTRIGVLDELKQLIRAFFPGVELCMFGSSQNGFGLWSSDIDICATFIESRTGENVPIPDMIMELNKILGKSARFDKLTPVTAARVPILKFYHIGSKMEGDICLYNTLGIINTDLLKTYSSIDYRAKILGIVMKKLARLCDIGDAHRGSLSSYACIIMVIHFLQQCKPPVLPVLQELQYRGASRVQWKENCNIYFFKKISELPRIWSDYGRNNESIGKLWMKFLRYYTETFDFETTVITVRQKARLLRSDKFWSSNGIAIEDPFDLTHNLAAHVSKKMYLNIMHVFRRAREQFCNEIPLPSENILEKTIYLFNPLTLRPDIVNSNMICHSCKGPGHKSKDCLARNFKRVNQTLIEPGNGPFDPSGW